MGAGSQLNQDVRSSTLNGPQLGNYPLEWATAKILSAVSAEAAEI
jgi:hypothetical protein